MSAVLVYPAAYRGSSREDVPLTAPPGLESPAETSPQRIESQRRVPVLMGHGACFLEKGPSLQENAARTGGFPVKLAESIGAERKL